MPWSIMEQNPRTGATGPTGEERDGLGAAKQAARELAWQMPGWTFYVQNEKGRIAAVYHWNVGPKTITRQGWD